MLLMQWQIDDFTTRKAEIVAELAKLQPAIDAFLGDPLVSSYTLNTGQTQQQVTRGNFQQILDWRDRLRNELNGINIALYGSNRSAYFRPDF